MALGLLGALLASLGALGGCKREPDFAERYDAASSQITDTASQIDAQLTGTPPSDEADDPADAAGKT